MIPIFRAKHYRDDVYFIGSLIGKDDEYYIVQEEDMEYYRPIDPTTLAIHFPDMLDSQGNKIFASLDENGKGGDVVRMESECENYVAEFTQDGLSFYEYLDNKKYKNSSHFKIFSIRDIKVIGIQE